MAFPLIFLLLSGQTKGYNLIRRTFIGHNTHLLSPRSYSGNIRYRLFFKKSIHENIENYKDPSLGRKHLVFR
jgi:hypothetical protein